MFDEFERAVRQQSCQQATFFRRGLGYLQVSQKVKD
jgi:hypothetical protein